MSTLDSDQKELDKAFARVQEIEEDPKTLHVSLASVLASIEGSDIRVMAGWTERSARRQGFTSVAELVHARIRSVGDLRMLQDSAIDKLCSRFEPETPVRLV